MADTQSMVRPGEPTDLYYYSSETSKKAAFKTTQNTKYVQQFANLTGGTSTFLFPPQNGLQHIVVSASFAALGNQSQLALPAGWLWGLVKSCAFRYGGTSQFLLTGQQLLQLALRSQTSRSSCDDIINLGGNYATGADFANSQSASIVLTLPHAHVSSGVGQALPFPTDALTQQCQILLEFYPVSSIFSNPSAITLPAGCRTLASANFQCQQIMLDNQGDALARRVDLSAKAYAYPTEFVQQEVAINLLNSTNPQPVVLSGFRAGSVKSLQIWLVDNADMVPGGGPNTGYNPTAFRVPTSVEMLYAGDIYAKYDNGVGQLFNLINSDKASAFDIAMVNAYAGSISPPTPFLSQWLELPFAQPLCDEDEHYTLVHGRNITNGIINLNNLVVPYVSSSGWTLKISYVYSVTMLFSQGSVDYIF